MFVHVWSFPFLSQNQSGAWHQTNWSNETTCHYHLSITSGNNVLLCGLTASNMTTSFLMHYSCIPIPRLFPASTLRDAKMADLHCTAVISQQASLTQVSVCPTRTHRKQRAHFVITPVPVRNVHFYSEYFFVYVSLYKEIMPTHWDVNILLFGPLPVSNRNEEQTT